MQDKYIILAVVTTIVLAGCTENPEGKAINLDGLSEEKDEQVISIDLLSCSITSNNGCSCSGTNCTLSNGGSSITCYGNGRTIDCDDTANGCDCVIESTHS